MNYDAHAHPLTDGINSIGRQQRCRDGDGGGGVGGEVKGTRVQSVRNLLKNPQFPLKSVLAITIAVYQLYASRKYYDML